MIFKELSIKNESKRFFEHLQLAENERIILSGIFGLGKTYFINKFFEEKNEDFISIKLNPINYSVSANQDVFELIKFDIGFQLFSKNPTFDKEKFSTLLAGQFFLIENYKEVIISLAKNLSKLDQNLNAIINPTLELGEKIEKFKKERNIDEEEDLKSFLEFFKLKKGTYREEDSISELLNYLVETLRLNSPNKKIVLIIDDLDRIDPEHLFRIMNVFSAHFDYYDINGKNKFGFDKVVLICDINNIRAIFHNRYGTEIDFSGYIDKFYSTEVFHYNFSSIIVENLSNFFKSVRIDNNILQEYLQSNDENYYKEELFFILNHFILSNGASTRALVNFLKKEFKLPNYTIKTSVHEHPIYSNQTPILGILEILEDILGGKSSVLKALEKAIEKFPYMNFDSFQSFWDSRVGNLIMLVDSQNTNMAISNNVRIFESDKYNLRVAYKIQPSSNSYGAYSRAIRIGYQADNFTGEETIDFSKSITKNKIPYFQLLKDAYKMKWSLKQDFR
jgi:hypothetical protein